MTSVTNPEIALVDAFRRHAECALDVTNPGYIASQFEIAKRVIDTAKAYMPEGKSSVFSGLVR